jgi:hypothetical protein
MQKKQSQVVDGGKILHYAPGEATLRTICIPNPPVAKADDFYCRRDLAFESHHLVISFIAEVSLQVFLSSWHSEIGIGLGQESSRDQEKTKLYTTSRSHSRMVFTYSVHQRKYYLHFQVSFSI